MFLPDIKGLYFDWTSHDGDSQSEELPLIVNPRHVIRSRDRRTQQAGDGEPNVVLPLGHRVRCWPNNKTT